MNQLIFLALIVVCINWSNIRSMDVEHLNRDLFNAIMVNNLEEVQSLLENNNINVNIKDDLGRTPLYNATLKNNLKTVQLLLEKGAQEFINVENYTKETPLYRAVCHNNLEMLKLLLYYGAEESVNIKDIVGFTPLHIAAINNNQNIIEILLDDGADKSMTDNKNRTPVELPQVTEETREFIQNYIPANKAIKSSRN
jgi:ankyrin repeat protein